MSLKISFGSGSKRLKGFINVDHRKEVAGMVMDLNVFPYDFKNAVAEKIVCDNVLEHLKYPNRVLGEFNRILDTGGIAIIDVPHFTSGGALSGDNHIQAFGTDYFYDFERGAAEQYHCSCAFSSVKCRIIFPHGIQIWNYPVEWIANINRALQRFYEHSFLRFFPAEQIHAEMIK